MIFGTMDWTKIIKSFSKRKKNYQKVVLVDRIIKIKIENDIKVMSQNHNKKEHLETWHVAPHQSLWFTLWKFENHIYLVTLIEKIEVYLTQ